MIQSIPEDLLYNPRIYFICRFKVQRRTSYLCTHKNITSYPSQSKMKWKYRKHRLDIDNVVYAIECTFCGLIYVREIKGELRKRMNGHRSQVNNGRNQLLYRHFNLPDYSVLSMKVRILEKIYHPTNKPINSCTMYPLSSETRGTLDSTTGNCCSIWLQRPYR